jgi:hypothetical protein
MTLVSIALFALQASAQLEWSHPPSFQTPLGSIGDWDDGFHMVGDLVFDGATYHLFLLGGHDLNSFTGWALGHWTSTDLDTWTEDANNPVFTPDDPWGDDSVISTAILYRDGLFHMWYGATSGGGTGAAGYATSVDGSTWNRAAGPVASLGAGLPGAFDDAGFYPSAVIHKDGAYHMWGTGVRIADGLWQIGYAWSSDGLSWFKLPDPVIAVDNDVPRWMRLGAYLPEVVPHGELFAMWHTGRNSVVPNHTISIGHALSRDGIRWNHWVDNPIISPYGGCNGAHAMAVLNIGDTGHGFFGHCFDDGHSTSPLDLVSYDGFESGFFGPWARWTTE